MTPPAGPDGVQGPSSPQTPSPQTPSPEYPSAGTARNGWRGWRLPRWLVRRYPGRWMAAGGGIVLAAVVGVAVVVQTTGGAACAAGLAAGAPAAALPWQAAGWSQAAPGVPARLVAGPPVGTAVHRGKATYYSTSGAGNCAFPRPPADGLFVALSPSEYAGAAACGGYLDVTGPKGTVRALIYDQCPGCPVGTIDLSKKAFARVADLSAGMVSVRYRAAIDPPLPRPISITFKDGTSQWWFSVLIADHGNPLRRVDVRPAGKGWHRVGRTDDNHWVADDGLGPGPFDIRLTDVYGNTATATRVRLLPGRSQRVAAALYGDAAQASPTPGATRSPVPPSASPSTAPATPTPSGPSTATTGPAAPATPSTTAARTDC